MAMQTSPTGKLDRQTIVPFHLKLFYRTGGFHLPADFPTTPSTPLPPHLQIYTWPTCTLRELSHLLTTALPSLLPSPAIGTRLAYRLVYPDTHSPHNANNGASNPPPGRYLTKELGSVVIGGEEGLLPDEEERKVVTGGVMAGRLAEDPDKTLQDARFVIGDFIDCAVLAPAPDGGVAPMPGVGGRGRGVAEGYARGRGFGGGWENGAYRGRGGRGGAFGAGRLGDAGGVPSGEWRRGERVPERGGYGRGRGRAY